MFSLLCLAGLLLPAAIPDVVIKGGTVFDGTGAPGRRVDIALQGDRLLAIGTDLATGPDTKVVDAAGLFIAPGFIDLHTHSDDEIIAARTQSNYNYLTQGVTTIVTGNCGFGPVDVASYYARIDLGRGRGRTCATCCRTMCCGRR